jgi:hypothetical protein
VIPEKRLATAGGISSHICFLGLKQLATVNFGTLFLSPSDITKENVEDESNELGILHPFETATN